MAALAFAQAPTLSDLINDLITNLNNLPDSKVSFAASLISQFSNKRKLFPNGEYLSENQIPHVGKLVALATGKAPAKPQAVSVGDLTGLINLFRTAAPNLKFPKIKLTLGGTLFILSVAGERSKAPGSISIKGEGTYPDQPWYGRVSPEGEFAPGRSLTPGLSDLLVPVLKELSADPAAAVLAYGTRSGNCMFCHKSLGSRDGAPPSTDVERSLAAGMGRKCAENWGLLEQWKAAKLA